MDTLMSRGNDKHRKGKKIERKEVKGEDGEWNCTVTKRCGYVTFTRSFCQCSLSFVTAFRTECFN